MLEERVEQWNRELTEKGWLEGLEQGRREGRSEGWREGRREARSQGETRLLRQMAHRFGPPPPWVESRLTEATDAELDALAEALLDAESLDVLFAEYARNY